MQNTQSTSSAIVPQTLKRRLAVYDISSGQRGTFARLEVCVTSDGACEIKVSSQSEEHAKKIIAALNEVKAMREIETQDVASLEEFLLHRCDEIRKNLPAMLLEVEALPDADHALKFEIDLRSGAVYGTHESLHNAAATNADAISKNIFESLPQSLMQLQEDLANKVIDAVGQHDQVGAIALICHGFDSGLPAFNPTHTLLIALQSVNDDDASSEQLERILRWRLKSAMIQKNFDVAIKAIEKLQCVLGSDIIPKDRVDLQMIEATIAVELGSEETALLIWRSLLKDPGVLGVSNRGWAWRNIAYVLPASDPEALLAAKCSADAFLEAGDKGGAATSLVRLMECLEHSEPMAAISTVDDFLPVLDSETLMSRSIRASMLHIKARRLMKVGCHRQAIDSALEEIELGTGVLGMESDLIRAKYLASFLYENMGEAELSVQFRHDAEALSERHNDARLELERQVFALSEDYSQEQVQLLLAKARESGDDEMYATIRYIEAMRNPELTQSKRLMMLEESLKVLKNCESRSSVIVSVQCGIAKLLVQSKHLERAREWYEKAFATDPLNEEARDGILHCMWNLKVWDESVAFVKTLLDRFGDAPGLLFAYGRSLFEAQRYFEAYRSLSKVVKLAQPGTALAINAHKMAHDALEKADGAPPTIMPSQLTSPVTLDELELEIENFGEFISCDKRMSFWRRSEQGKSQWAERPERHAQNLLHTFLKASFKDRIEVFEEIGTGAGRLDILLKLSGGLSTIIELKMCGEGYSSSYAKAGEEQLVHYMSNRRPSVGYLVVFDSRMRDFGKELTALPSKREFAIKTIFIDLRPRW